MEKKYVYVGSMAYFANHMKAKLMAKGTKASQRTCFHEQLFLGRISHKCGNKNENGIYCHIFLFFGGKFAKKILLKIFHHICLGLGGWGWGTCFY
jgi:hypothetical protein